MSNPFQTGGDNNDPIRRLKRALLSAKVESFYNKNHIQSGPNGGQFWEGEDGPGRIKDNAKKPGRDPKTGVPLKKKITEADIREKMGKGKTSGQFIDPNKKESTPTQAGARSALTEVPNSDTPTGKSVQNGLDAIDSVITIPEGIKKIAVIEGGVKTSGVFNDEDGVIRVSEGATTADVTIVHEFGHYLDANASLGDKGGEKFSSRSGSPSPKVKALLDTILASDTVKALKKAQSDAPFLSDDSNYATYLLTKHEMFARAFAQYIAVRSGNKKMQDQIANIRSGEAKPQNNSELSQWSDEEFAPIAEAFDDLFREQGLLR